MGDLYDYSGEMNPENMIFTAEYHGDLGGENFDWERKEIGSKLGKFWRLWLMDEEEKKKDGQIVWEELGISNDFIFGKVMQDAELCKGLLQRIFPDIKIDHVEYPILQKTINVDMDAKSVRLDVYVEDGEGVIYDIEMQMSDTKELPKRARYYQAMMDLEMIDKGELYRKLKKSFVIFICPFDLFGEGRHIYTFRNFCEENKKILLGDDTAKIFLNTESRMDDVSMDLRAFLDYVAGKEPEDSFVQKLENAVNKARKNREWRREYMTLLMRDQENKEEGREEGREEGMEKGIYEVISLCREIGMSDHDILKRLQERFQLSKEKAEEYLYVSAVKNLN